MAVFYNQPTAAPTEKVSAGAIAGALSIIIVWIAGMNNIVIPPEVASAITVILSFIAAYMTPNRAPSPAEVAKGVTDLNVKE